MFYIPLPSELILKCLSSEVAQYLQFLQACEDTSLVITNVLYIYIYIHTYTYTELCTKCHTIDCARNTFLLL